MHGLQTNAAEEMKVVFLYFLLTLVCLADQLKTPPTKSDLAGAWIGCTDECTLFFRLELKPQGIGSVAVLFRDEAPDIYRIERWELRDAALSLKVEGVTEDAEPIAVAVARADFKVLEIRVTSRTNGWVRTVTLFKEADFREKAERTRQALSAVERQNSKGYSGK